MTTQQRTLTQIADHFNVPIYKARYIVQTRRIKPCGKVGTVRLFDEAAINAIGGVLAANDSNRRHQEPIAV